MKRESFKSLELEISTRVLCVELFGRGRVRNYKVKVEHIGTFEHTVQTVGRINSIKIEVRSSEKPHNLPHFHVTAPGRIDAVYTISPVSLYEGKISSKDSKLILEWAENNRDALECV